MIRLVAVPSGYANECKNRTRTKSSKDPVLGVTISLSLPEEDAHISLIREVGRALLRHHGAEDQDIDDVETVVGELCSNVTRHGRSASGCYQVALEHEDDRIVIVVADQGEGFDPEHVAPVGADRTGSDGAIRHGGFGLSLVGALSDHVEFQPTQPHGMTVRAEKKMRLKDTKPAETLAHRAG